MKNKTEKLNIRLSPEEKELLRKRAEWYHQTISGYLLSLALKEARETENEVKRHV